MNELKNSSDLTATTIARPDRNGRKIKSDGVAKRARKHAGRTGAEFCDALAGADELRKSEQRCHELFENARDIIYVHDLKGRYTAVNKAGAELVGFSRREILGMSISDFVAPEYMEDIGKRFREKLTNQTPTTYEVEVITRSGQRVPVEVNSRLILEGGEPVAVQGIARDISRRKRMEREREAIFEIIRGVSSSSHLEDLLQLIHRSIGRVLDAENCFVALCDQEQGTLSMEFFVDTYDTIPAPHNMGKSCAAYVFHTGKPLLLTQELFERMVAAGQVELVGKHSPSWLGVPLKTPAKTIGVLVLQHYQNAQAYSEHDVEFLVSVGGQIATAIERKAVEEKLRESERRLRLTAESSNTGLWDWDLRDDSVWYSREWKRQIGYEDGEISGQLEEWKSRVHPDDLERSLKKVETYLEKPRPHYENEFRFRHKDGSYRWILARASQVTDAQGTPVRMLGSHVDITERKEAEQALRQSEERYRDLVENARDIIYSHDLQGNFTGTNRAGQEITGYTVEEALRLNFREIIAPEYHDKMKVMMAQLLAGENDVTEELECLAKDGRRIPVEVSARLVMEAGVPVAVAGIARDITERKHAEAQLARLVAAVEQTADSVVITDVNGNIEYVNPAFERNTGYSRAEALGRNPRILKSGRTPPEVYRDLWKTISRGEIWSGQLTNKRKDETLFEELVTISPVRGDARQIVNYIAVKQDITAQTQLEAQLRQSQKLEAIGQLAGGVAHDFNNLLTAILGYSDLSLARLNPDDPIARNLQEVLKAAERAKALTRQLLAFSRKQILEPKILDLNSVVSDINKMLRRLIGEDIDLNTALASNLWRVKADPTQIEQVLMNLAVNARDAMPRGGKLTIETQNVELSEEYARKHLQARPGQFVLLAMSDNGCGIDADTQAHIFEPFFTTKEVGKGTGLGLSTIYGIVKQSGGFIWVYSELNMGTTFKVYLPRVKDALDDEHLPLAGPAAPVGSGTVLVVEDDIEVRGLITECLTSSGYRVLESGNGSDALAIASRDGERIDLLVTDVVMPGMGGRELAQRLQRLRPDSCVLFMSGYTDDAIVHHGIMDRDIAFLQKPFTPESLLRKVGEVLHANDPDACEHR